MFKFVVLGVFLWQTVVNHCYGQRQSFHSDSPPDVTVSLSSPINDSSDGLILEKDGQYHIDVSRLILYLGGSFAEKHPTGSSKNHVARKLDVDYVITEGIGAHKLHVRKVPWATARRICIDEGGHLAVIRSDREEMIILGMMSSKSVDLAWIGYHDIFQEGDWFSVLDEPLAETGWARWSPAFSPNPIPSGGHCTEMKRESGGMVNIACTEERSFICKVSID